LKAIKETAVVHDHVVVVEYVAPQNFFSITIDDVCYTDLKGSGALNDVHRRAARAVLDRIEERIGYTAAIQTAYKLL
jgi:hypothetical protein